MIRTVLAYTWPGTRIEARCLALIWAPADRRLGLVVVSELPDNPGASVTNAIEDIATALAARGLAKVGSGFRLVEHYPADSRRPASYARVWLTRVRAGTEGFGRAFIHPRWRHLDAATLDALAPTAPRPSEELLVPAAVTSAEAMPS